MRNMPVGSRKRSRPCCCANPVSHAIVASLRSGSAGYQRESDQARFVQANQVGAHDALPDHTELHHRPPAVGLGLKAPIKSPFIRSRQAPLLSLSRSVQYSSSRDTVNTGRHVFTRASLARSLSAPFVKALQSPRRLKVLRRASTADDVRISDRETRSRPRQAPYRRLRPERRLEKIP
jgi:hypothetical protein